MSNFSLADLVRAPGRASRLAMPGLAALMLSVAACEDASSSGLLDGAIGNPFPGTDSSVPTPGFPPPAPGVDSSTPWITPTDGSLPLPVPTDGGVGGPVTGTDGSVGVPDASGVVPPPSNELCKVPAKEIAVLGDSYIAMSYTTGIPTDIYPFTTELEKLSKAAGAMGASEKYREYSVSGAAMAPGPLALIKSIPKQLDDALKAGKTTVIVMDGGGNDVLLDNRDCLNFTSVDEVKASTKCTGVVDTTLKVAGEMTAKAAAAGVKAVVFFFYPHLPKDSLGGGAGANYVLDYAVPRIKSFCEGQTKLKCIFVDQRKGFDDGTWTGKDDGTGYPRKGLIEGDGIHPTPEGSKILAKTVWDAMNASCIAVK